MSEKTTKKKKHKVLKCISLSGGALALLGILCILGLNLWVIGSTSGRIHEFSSKDSDTKDSVADNSNASTVRSDIGSNHDCIIVLGAGLRDGTPSPMLKDRLDKGIYCYWQGLAPKLLMSGDHGRDGYNEVQVMKQYAIDAGVPSSDIFMDHAGFSTYESMIRARDIFGLKSPVVVTQKYHIYRALFIGSQLGLDCTGIPTDNFPYGGQAYRTFREYIARCKDVGTVLMGAEPTYGGEPISITGDGDVTND